MRARLAIILLVISVLLLSTERLGSGNAGFHASTKASRLYRACSVDAGSYRSPSGLHKVLIANNDSKALTLARSQAAVQLADYGSFKLFAMDEAAIQGADGQTNRDLSVAAEDAHAASFASRIRDDLNVLLLRSGAIDTTDEGASGTFIGLNRAPAPNGIESASASSDETAAGSQFRLIQFVGPVKRAWIEQLEWSGLEPVAYVPNNGYLVRGSADSRARLMSRNQLAQTSGEGFVQWEGPFLDEQKIHPALSAMEAQSGDVTVAVQLALGKDERDSRNNSEVKQARKLAKAVMVDAYGVLNFTNLRLKVDTSRIRDLAALPSVVNIEPWSPPQLFDERSSQIIAGQLTSDQTGARGPGYVSWLAAHGFTSSFDFAIDVSDTGIDRGSTSADKLHPDFLDSNKQSRILYARDYTSELDVGDVPGHGTINMSIAGASNFSSDKAVRDASGFGFGIGVAPFALLGASKIFQSNLAFDLIDPYTKLVSDAYRAGARVSSNSWGETSNTYSIDSQEYDSRVRDADPDQPGNQETTICFAAGNAGFNKSIGSPGSAKNVISVAASESSRKDGTDGCNVKDTDSDNAMNIAYFSSGGPLDDGRMKPDITAPGTHIEGAASQNPLFDGTGVCGETPAQHFFPEGQTLYTWSSGTSHSTPQVAGAAALARQFLINKGQQPTAALIKALLLNTASYMTGERAGGDLPEARQGWGLLDLDRAFDNTPRILVNQTNTFTDSGQEFVVTGEVKDSTQPFRVMLAWTDAPGFSGVAPWVNNLDLEVTINGQLYRGNTFAGQISQPGGDADTKNNVEAVWLPAGTVGTFVVRVRATNIAGDGVPGNGDPTDQDFVLFVYNGGQKDVPVASITSVALAGGADSFADPGETISMTVNISDLSAVAFASPHGTLTTSTTGIVVTGNAADFPSIASGQSAASLSPFTFTVAQSVACGSVINFVLDVASQGSVSRVPFTARVGKPQPTEMFSDGIESGESKWTHGSGIRKKKLRSDTWTISSKRVHSGTSAWFSPDPGDKITDSHLDTLPIQIPADARDVQLVFFHTFEFERGTFDGGVLEISTGADFEDLGSKIVKGRYNGTIYEFGSNPLAGNAAWVEGRLGTFQQVIVDLSSYAGKTVTIRFRIVTDADGKGLGWYIDDVSLRGNRISCTQ